MADKHHEQMRAHVDEGGKLTHENAVELLAEMERLKNHTENTPAFACAAENGHQPSMSLRDYFAGQALAGYSALLEVWHKEDFQRIAEYAYDQADAMMKEREE